MVAADHHGGLLREGPIGVHDHQLAVAQLARDLDLGALAVDPHVPHEHAVVLHQLELSQEMKEIVGLKRTTLSGR